MLIKQVDFGRDSINLVRDDVSDRSHAPHIPGENKVNLSSSFAPNARDKGKGIVSSNTAASVHLREAIKDLKNRHTKYGDASIDKYTNESDKNSYDAASKVPVHKHPVSIGDCIQG